MKKNKLIVGAVALGLGLASFGAGADAKGPGAGAGGQCARAGTSFLIQNGLIVDAARQQIDYGTVLPAVFDAGTFLSLGQVVKAHTTNPELFPWCG